MKTLRRKHHGTAESLLAMGLCIFVYAFSTQMVRATLLDDIKNEIQQKEDQIRQLEQDKKKFAGTITEKQKAEKSLQGQIAKLTDQISQLNVQLRITGAKIESATLSIRELELQIVQTNALIETQKNRMAELLRSIRERTDEQKTLLSLMLRHDPFSTFFGQLAYADSLEGELLAHAQLLQKNKAVMEQERLLLSGKKTQLEELRGRLAAENAAKNDQQKQKTVVLATTKNEEQKYRTLLTQAEKQRRDILTDIKELEDKLRHTIDPASLPSFRPGVVDWPAQGIVSQEYGDTKDTGFQNDAYKFHNGIDIANDTGTPIRAARDGNIKAIGTNGMYAYGKWIAVEHENNLVTLYAHLSGYAGLKQGNAVKKGQVIGYMGTTGFATGSHLHFTIYAGNTFLTEQRWFGLLPLGGSINPRNYLP